MYAATPIIIIAYGMIQWILDYAEFGTCLPLEWALNGILRLIRVQKNEVLVYYSSLIFDLHIRFRGRLRLLKLLLIMGVDDRSGSVYTVAIQLLKEVR